MAQNSAHIKFDTFDPTAVTVRKSTENIELFENVKLICVVTVDFAMASARFGTQDWTPNVMTALMLTEIHSELIFSVLFRQLKYTFYSFFHILCSIFIYVCPVRRKLAVIFTSVYLYTGNKMAYVWLVGLAHN